uniref:Uncharacterized protein n=1 Tax=Oryza rufipogon TaxID=4529 RepID=A0A0E0R7H2_ORYRU
MQPPAKLRRASNGCKCNTQGLHILVYAQINIAAISLGSFFRLPYLMVLLWLWKTNDRVTLLWFYSFF